MPTMIPVYKRSSSTPYRSVRYRFGIGRKVNYSRAVRSSNVSTGTVKRRSYGRSVFRPEKKFSEVSAGQVSVAAVSDNAPGFFVNMTTQIAQGTGDFNSRIGDRILYKGLYFSYNVVIDPAALFSTDQSVRFIIVQWHEVNTQFTLTSQILNTATSTATPVAVHAPYNHDFSKSYTIIYDKRFSLSAGGVSQKVITGTINLSKMKYLHKIGKFTSASVNGYDHLFLLAIGSQTAASGINPTLTGTYRLTFMDS